MYDKATRLNVAIKTFKDETWFEIDEWNNTASTGVYGSEWCVHARARRVNDLLRIPVLLEPTYVLKMPVVQGMAFNAIDVHAARFALNLPGLLFDLGLVNNDVKPENLARNGTQYIVIDPESITQETSNNPWLLFGTYVPWPDTMTPTLTNDDQVNFFKSKAVQRALTLWACLATAISLCTGCTTPTRVWTKRAKLLEKTKSKCGPFLVTTLYEQFLAQWNDIDSNVSFTNVGTAGA